MNRKKWKYVTLMTLGLSLATAAGCTTYPTTSVCEPLNLSHRSTLTRTDMAAITAHNESIAR